MTQLKQNFKRKQEMYSLPQKKLLKQRKIFLKSNDKVNGTA